MEELSDSSNSHFFSKLINETLSKEELDGETSGKDGDIIEDLICQLTNIIPDPPTNSTSTVQSFDTVKTLSEGSFRLQDPPNLDEILNTDESLITPTSHNVSVINAACQQILRQMEHQLLTLLKKNRKEQDIVQEFLNANCKTSYSENSKKISVVCAGMPYFKDPYGFQPPLNQDVLRKKEKNKLLPIDFMKSFPVWKSSDARNLEKAVKKYDISKPSTIDWMKISVTDMEGKYSPSECKSKWNMHLNPSINRSKWNLKEIESLKTLSAKYNYQDWDRIAGELGTNRTGLQCCVQYHTRTFPTEGKWTKEEDETLQNLVDKFKVKDIIPWPKVVWHFENRSLKQCQERYAYHLGNIKKGYFTMEEDFVIVYLASKLKNFGEVAKFLPNRVATQVRSRYEYLIQLSMPAFSKEEDELLTKLMAQYPRNWEKISENFQNRSRVQCRKRWAYLQKGIKLESDLCSDSEIDEGSNLTPENNKARPEKNKIDAENVKKNIHLILKTALGTKKYPEIYHHLLDYHKYCHKFLFGPKPRIPSNSEDLKKLTTKMRITKKNFSVGSGPLSSFNISSLSNNCAFDKEDLILLNELSKSEQKAHEFELSKKIFPPNYMTLVALRTFTVGWDKIRNLCNFYKAAPQPASQIDSNDRILFTDAKKLFMARLKAIFAFPLILSNISPEEKQKLTYKPKARKTAKPLSKKRRKKHAMLMNAAYRNKIKALSRQFENCGDAELCEVNERLETKPNTDNDQKSKPAKRALKNGVANGRGTKKKRTCDSETQGEVNAPIKRQRTTRSTKLLDSK